VPPGAAEAVGCLAGQELRTGRLVEASALLSGDDRVSRLYRDLLTGNKGKPDDGVGDRL